MRLVQDKDNDEQMTLVGLDLGRRDASLGIVDVKLKEQTEVYQSLSGLRIALLVERPALP